tara:strand:- start:673 stop:918 length:246 start_codon:yes stop_codon:yes gene_type:complete
MMRPDINIKWPNGYTSSAKEGSEWLSAAKDAGIEIPIGCLGGSCGACEIEVNGKILRACISKISKSKGCDLEVTFADDPYW